MYGMWIFIRNPVARNKFSHPGTTIETGISNRNSVVGDKLLGSGSAIRTGISNRNSIEEPGKAFLESVPRTKHTAREKKPSDRGNAARPGEVEKRRCTGHAALTVRGGTAIQNIEACNARHGARVVEKALCSASTSKNCKISFCSCFVMAVFPFSSTN